MSIFIFIFFAISPFGILLLIALDEFVWYRQWSRKRQWKHMQKAYNKSRVTS